MDIIANQIKSLKEDIPRLSNLSDEYLFSLVCYKFFYNKGRLSYSDYTDVFVDGKDDGGIDLVTIVEDNNGQASLTVIQSKDIDIIPNSQDVVDIIKRMGQTLDDFYHSRTARYRKRLKQKLKDRLSEIEDQSSNVELVAFINTNVSAKVKEKILTTIDGREELSDYNVSIFYKEDIEKQIQSMLEPHKYVSEAKIKFSKNDGVINYNENGLLVNIYASSLKDLYDRFKDRGLFEQNFRYYVRNKRIDDNIKKSLHTKRDQFWFLNNGIIIGCSDFSPDGEYIRLYNFSIINGCQTATLVGEYKGSNEGVDFVLPCKIFKPQSDNTDAFEKFISEVAESSNSQKSISDRDLKSNKPEQRKLQSLLKESDPKIYLEIKKGQEVKKRGLEEWQGLNNETFAQLVLAFNLQQPGTARSSKKKIFADENTYNRIFKRTHDKSNIVDLLKLNNYYMMYLNKKELYEDIIEESVSSNGRMFILAIIGFLLKQKRGLIDLRKMSISQDWDLHLEEDNFRGRFFADYQKDDFEDILFSLFSSIIYELSDLYRKREDEEKAVSNFFKTDVKYQTIILKHIIQRFTNTPMKKKEIDSFMVIFE